MAAKKIKKGKATLELPIRWHVPDSITTGFASNMTVQTLEYEFKVSFFESKPNIRTDPNAPLPTEVPAECIASVIINVAKMPEFIRVLQRQFELYIEKHKPEVVAELSEK